MPCISSTAICSSANRRSDTTFPCRAKGLLHNDHFQIAYVTNDMDRAVALFRDRLGVAAFRESDYETPEGTSIGIRSAWIGAMMYEICCGSDPGMELYTDWAPPGDEFVLPRQGLLERMNATPVS